MYRRIPKYIEALSMNTSLVCNSRSRIYQGELELSDQLFVDDPTVTGMFILPLRLKLVYGLSSLEASVWLIPSLYLHCQVSLPDTRLHASKYAAQPLLFLRGYPDLRFLRTGSAGYSSL